MHDHSLKVGDPVTVDGREGVVVRLTGQGMVDVQFKDARWVERKKGTMLRRLNPRKDDIYDWQKEQFRAVVSGIYEGLRKKGIPADEARKRSYAIATRVGQRDGWLEPGTQTPTAKGIAMSLARLGQQETAQAMLSGDTKRQKLAAKKSRAGYGGRRQAYEGMLAEGRANYYRMTREVRNGKVVYVIQPGDKVYVRKAVAEAKLAELNAAPVASRRVANPSDELVSLRNLLTISYEDAPAHFAAEKVSVKVGGKKQEFAGRWVLPSSDITRVGVRFGDAVADFMSSRWKSGVFGRPSEQEREAVFDKVNRSEGSPFASMDDFERKQKAEMSRFEAFMSAYYNAPAALQADLAKALMLKKPLRRGVVDVRLANPKSLFQQGVAEGRDIAQRRRAKTGAGKMKQIGIAGIRSDWKETRARPATFHEQMETNFTPTIISPVMPLEDPDEIGYFILTYDPRNRAIQRIVSEVGGWQFAPNLSHVAREQSVTFEVTGRGGITRRVPKVHGVIGLRRRQKGGEFAQMFYSVTGPRAKTKDVFETKEQAEAHAHDLDVKLAYGATPETHSIHRLPDGTYELQGPLVSRALPRESLVNAEDHFPRYYDEGDAIAEARRLDQMEAQSGVAPLAAYRTRVGADIEEAINATEELAHAFENQRVYVSRKPSPDDYRLMRLGIPAEPPDPAFLGMDEAAIRRSLRATGRLTAAQIDSIIQQEMQRRRVFEIRTARRLRLEASRPERPRKTRKGGRVPGEEVTGVVEGRTAPPKQASEMSDEELRAALRARLKRNPPWGMIAKYGAQAYGATRAFFASPQGRAFAIQVGTLALSMFGDKPLTQREKALVAEKVSEQTGEEVPVEAVSAALKVA